MTQFIYAEWLARFWARVQKLDGCWEWTLKPGRCGYARIRRNGPRVFVHRASWEIENGPIPDGLFVLHRCDNRICVRPSHLFLGTQLDNVRDRDAKERQARGPKHAAACFKLPIRRGAKSNMAKLSAADVVTIRLVHSKGGVSNSEMARHYRVARRTVDFIVNGETWTHLLPALPDEEPTKPPERRIILP